MNTNKNKNASHLTHEIKNEHGGLAEAGMKTLITQKVVELNDIRKNNLQKRKFKLKERESFKRERKSLEEEKKLMEKGFQVEREILEICYSNGYLPQKINLELNMMT
ncbi:hypothetical protein HpBT107_06760 [Helicobacter pylori]